MKKVCRNTYMQVIKLLCQSAINCALQILQHSTYMYMYQIGQQGGKSFSVLDKSKVVRNCNMFRHMFMYVSVQDNCSFCQVMSAVHLDVLRPLTNFLSWLYMSEVMVSNSWIFVLPLSFSFRQNKLSSTYQAKLVIQVTQMQH